MDGEKSVLHEDELRRALTRIAHEIVERNPDPPAPALVGIHRRGALLARRLQGLLQELLGAAVPLGDLDIGFYRDDVARRPDAPIVHASHIDFDVSQRTIVVRRRRALHGAHDARRDRGAVRLRPPGARAARRARRSRTSRAADPP